MKYFKTDGIRMNSNELIFSLIPLKLGRILGNVSKKICVGFDTRISSSEIYDLLVMGIVTRGCDVISLGVCPTSLVGYVVNKEKCDYGIMITASHNPYTDNGIKVFSSSGEKLSILEEREIDNLLSQNIIYNQVSVLGKVSSSSIYREEYIKYLRNLMDFPNKEKVLFDTSNGVLSEYIDSIFKDKVDYKIIENNPNGKNINLNCGSECIENLLKNMDDSFTYGVSFDGDGDRVVIINKNKKIINGDMLLGLFSIEYSYKKIVTTKMMNLGMVNYLSSLNKEVVYSSVGDKNVYTKMKENDICLGGESSGHIIFLNSLIKNDGVFTLIKFLNLRIKEIIYTPYFYKTINVEIKEDINKETINNLENKVNQLIKEKGRVFIRKSGTENLLRINIQLLNESSYDEILSIIKEEIKIDD